ncbi:MAG: DUF5685 family protein [Christensenellaceae bacterium]
MFGYIIPQVCELKVREVEVFKAYYCGLCRTLKKEYHKTAVLNYDCTFLYMLSDSLKDEPMVAQLCKCALHPIQKRNEIVTDCAAYAADINMIMAYSKILDDRTDGKKGMGLVELFFKKAYKKVTARRPLMIQAAQEMTQHLHKLEEQHSSNTDAAAATYAELLGKVFQEADVLQSHILYEIGYNIGRWVYLVDAYDDIEKDKKSQNFNVFVNKYDIKDAVSEAVKKEIEQSLYFSLAQAGKEFGMLKVYKNKEIIENIIYFGLKEQTKRVLSGQKQGEQNLMKTKI